MYWFRVSNLTLLYTGCGDNHYWLRGSVIIYIVIVFIVWIIYTLEATIILMKSHNWWCSQVLDSKVIYRLCHYDGQHPHTSDIPLHMTQKLCVNHGIHAVLLFLLKRVCNIFEIFFRIKCYLYNNYCWKWVRNLMQMLKKIFIVKMYYKTDNLHSSLGSI